MTWAWLVAPRVAIGLVAAAVLVAGPARGADPALSMPACDAAPTREGQRRCIGVDLATNQAAVVSGRIVVRYDTRSLRTRETDILPGSALNGHTLSAMVAESLESGEGVVTALVLPPVADPLRLLVDGLLVQLCFTVPAGAAGGCTGLEFVREQTDLGSPQGDDVPLGTLTSGGVLVACDADPDCDDGDACTTDRCVADRCEHAPACATTTTVPTTTSTTTTTTTTTLVPCASASCLLLRFADELAARRDLGILRRWILARVTAAARKVSRAEAHPARRRKLLRAARGTLARVAARVTGRVGRVALAEATRRELAMSCERVRGQLVASP